MNRRQRAASMMMVHARTISDRCTRSLRTYGSLIREKVKGVYSEKPTMAIIGSRLY